jgi:Universal stress protein UspA and related nucleotide-binding proteins
MKKLLVPCDFSAQATNAFRSALSIASKAQGEIVLLHVIELPVLHDAVLMPVLSYEEALFRELEEKANAEFAKLQEYNTQGIPVSTKVLFGTTARMILDFVVDNNIDLVVMGTRGASGLREVFIGSNTEKIVRQSSAPVLAVKQAFTADAITDLVFPNSLETENQEDLVLKVKLIQDFFHARLHILWVNTPTNFTADHLTKDRLNKFAERFMLTNYTINIYNDVYEETGIISFAHNIKASMLVMGTHGRKGLAHFFSGSLTEDVVNHTDLPIWTTTIKES